MLGEKDNLVGTIALTRSSSLVFSILLSKGRVLADVRKFVSLSNYEGPTKSGIRMGCEVLDSVIEVLTRLKRAVPRPEEKPFGQLKKSGDTDILVRVIPPDNLEALPSVDVREHVTNESYTGLTKRGVRFSWERLPEFIGILEEQARQLGGTNKSQPRHFQSSLEQSRPSASYSEIATPNRPGNSTHPIRDVLLRQSRHDSGRNRPESKQGRPSGATPIRTLEALESQPNPIPEGRPGRVEQPDVVGTKKWQTRDFVLDELLPDGPRDFPGEFLDKKELDRLDLPPEPIYVADRRGCRYVVQSDFGFCHEVQNPTEGNFIYYAHLRGHRLVSIPKEMIDIFRAVKEYEKYLRGIRQALLQAYERKSVHKTMAEHRAREVFESNGLPWLN